MLNEKQRRFVDEYLIDLNATQAAVRAGYSAKTASEQASRLLANVKVAEAIQQAKSERSKRTKVDSDWVLKRLTEEAEADLADLYDDNGHLKPVKEWPLIWRQGLVTGVDTETLRAKGSKGTGQWRGPAQDVHEEDDADEETVIVKIKTSERIKRVELIGKHIDVQAFREKVEVELTGSLAERLARAKARRST